MNCTVFVHGNGRNKDRVTVFIFMMASSAVFKQSHFFEQKFDKKKTCCAFEGRWILWIYVKCACALTFPHCASNFHISLLERT